MTNNCRFSILLGTFNYRMRYGCTFSIQVQFIDFERFISQFLLSRLKFRQTRKLLCILGDLAHARLVINLGIGQAKIRSQYDRGIPVIYYLCTAVHIPLNNACWKPCHEWQHMSRIYFWTV